ncbi:hypothetical protein [Streptomyces olivoreticuli]|uniref:hypothetical protein n=1 Tax=Streptomyces olivoreticuli TaxID=68246 RepID=UPI000E27E242|nr:hypothetical protein [Streptomyces olivoreticuli]
MTTLNFADLKAEAESKAAEGLTFIGPNGETIHLRPLATVPGGDLKAVLAHIDALGSDKVSDVTKIHAMDAALVAVATDKKAMAAALDELPLDGRSRIFEAWTEAAEVPEA